MDPDETEPRLAAARLAPRPAPPQREPFPGVNGP